MARYPIKRPMATLTSWDGLSLSSRRSGQLSIENSLRVDRWAERPGVSSDVAWSQAINSVGERQRWRWRLCMAALFASISMQDSVTSDEWNSAVIDWWPTSYCDSRTTSSCCCVTGLRPVAGMQQLQELVIRGQASLTNRTNTSFCWDN